MSVIKNECFLHEQVINILLLTNVILLRDNYLENGRPGLLSLACFICSTVCIVIMKLKIRARRGNA